jgi:DNA-directed RNA polymerase III subunit RPC1
LLPYQVIEIVDRELRSREFQAECTAAYLSTVRAFVLNHIVQRMVTVRRDHGMFEADEKHEEWDEYTDLTLGASGKLDYVVLLISPLKILYR